MGLKEKIIEASDNWTEYIDECRYVRNNYHNLGGNKIYLYPATKKMLKTMPYLGAVCKLAGQMEESYEKERVQDYVEFAGRVFDRYLKSNGKEKFKLGHSDTISPIEEGLYSDNLKVVDKTFTFFANYLRKGHKLKQK